MKTPPYLVPLFIYLYCQHKDIHIDLDMIVKDSSIPKDQFLLKCEQVLELLPELSIATTFHFYNLETKKQLDSEKKQQSILIFKISLYDALYIRRVSEERRWRSPKSTNERWNHPIDRNNRYSSFSRFILWYWNIIDLKRKKALEKSLEYLEWKKKVLDHKHVQMDKPVKQRIYLYCRQSSIFEYFIVPKKKQEQGNQQISSNTSKESSTEQSNKTTAPSASPNKTKKKQLSLDDMFH